MIDLEGENVDNHNFITWKTAFETENAYFIVMRSQDTENWTEMVRLNGAGNSEETLMYSLEDTEPEPTINYYKIIQVDFDGESASYGPISIDNTIDPRVLLKTVDLLGREIDASYSGFVVNCYSDGTTEKLLR